MLADHQKTPRKEYSVALPEGLVLTIVASYRDPFSDQCRFPSLQSADPRYLPSHHAALAMHPYQDGLSSNQNRHNHLESFSPKLHAGGEMRICGQ